MKTSTYIVVYILETYAVCVCLENMIPTTSMNSMQPLASAGQCRDSTFQGFSFEVPKAWKISKDLPFDRTWRHLKTSKHWELASVHIVSHCTEQDVYMRKISNRKRCFHLNFLKVLTGSLYWAHFAMWESLQGHLCNLPVVKIGIYAIQNFWTCFQNKRCLTLSNLWFLEDAHWLSL